MPAHYKQVLNAYADMQKLIESKKFTYKEISFHINSNYGFGNLFVQKRIEALCDRGDIFINKENIVMPSVMRKERMEEYQDQEELVDLGNIKNFSKGKPLSENEDE